ncbi:hypothetical protein Tcan_13229 [Toxocara canis]|uniref:Uncharacterized protein n=1 Tax=Toxocara canis TaxID=6265 RepID=A0A0B2W2Z5_TOXCA|nr:hypothetical protein Tcan_13229 [Toxocara canis]
MSAPSYDRLHEFITFRIKLYSRNDVQWHATLPCGGGQGDPSESVRRKRRRKEEKVDRMNKSKKHSSSIASIRIATKNAVSTTHIRWRAKNGKVKYSLASDKQK